jgi:hypothetical protein
MPPKTSYPPDEQDYRSIVDILERSGRQANMAVLGRSADVGWKEPHEIPAVPIRPVSMMFWLEWLLMAYWRSQGRGMRLVRITIGISRRSLKRLPKRVHFHPNLIYSPGTQVVALKEVLGIGSRILHRRGAVGRPQGIHVERLRPGFDLLILRANHTTNGIAESTIDHVGGSGVAEMDTSSMYWLLPAFGKKPTCTRLLTALAVRIGVQSRKAQAFRLYAGSFAHRVSWTDVPSEKVRSVANPTVPPPPIG